MKKKIKKTGPSVCVEIQLNDGCLSMYIGELVSRTKDAIVLRQASWISQTGRRNLFFAGTPDTNAEVEPYPDDVTIELPAKQSIFTSWPHALPRAVR